MKSKQDLLAEVRRTNDEMRQMFIDVEHWNSVVRKTDEQPIDPDPEMRPIECWGLRSKL
jgi:hypothetical protein